METKQLSRKKFLIIIPAILLVLIISQAQGLSEIFAAKPPAPVTLDPKTIPKWVNQLVVPPVYTPDTGSTYTITMMAHRQQILPAGTVLPGAIAWDGLTNVWGYQGNAVAKGATLGVPDGTPLPNFLFSPSGTFEAVKGTPITVNWVNQITGSQPFAVDPTLYWANPWNPNPNNPNADINKAFPDGDIFSQTGVYPTYPPGFDGTVSAANPNGLNAQTPVALVPHLHGAEVQSYFDGGPEAWWTSASTDLKGPHYSSQSASAPGTAVYYYPNAQEPNTLWYHDHALGITRLNTMSGLAGFYLIRDPAATPVTLPLTAANLDEYLTQTFQYGVSEIPIAIQDRTFKTNGELWFPEVGLNVATHPYWMPEFFGDTIMVNGRVWPNLDVTPGWYRFRVLDGSNARFYTLSLKTSTGLKLPFTLIGADGGYLQNPAVLKELTIAPGERADILVNFSALAPGTTVIMTNTAKTPFPAGAQPDPQTTGQIVRFTVKASGTAVTQGVTTLAALPITGTNPTLTVGAFPTIAAGATTRTITLNEILGPVGPLMAVINGQYYNGVVTETPTNGATEEWVIVNLTADTHPIHTHLATFQLVSRQRIDVAKYNAAWLLQQIDPVTGLAVVPPFPKDYTPIPLAVTPYLKGKATTATPAEMTWKDTIQVHPGEATIIRIRFLQQDGTAYPFDPAVGPGYVWHCHILDHEDNEMMRPLVIK